MSKLLQALLHIDQNVVPIVLPSQPPPQPPRREPPPRKQEPPKQAPTDEAAPPPKETLPLAPLIEREQPAPKSQPLAPQPPEPVKQRPAPVARLALSLATQPDAATVPRLSDEYVELARRIRLKLRPPATILIAATGPTPNPGWLAPLGVALTDDAQQSVLLVEASAETAGIADSLGLEAAVGLSDIVGGGADWRSVLTPTAMSGVNLLSAGLAGSIAPQPPGMVKRLLDGWKREHSWTLLWTGAAAGADTQSYAAACDGALLVVSLGLTTAEDVAAARDKLQSSGAQLLGCVVLPAPIE